jgi:hypothetical protein
LNKPKRERENQQGEKGQLDRENDYKRRDERGEKGQLDRMRANAI